MYELVFLMIFVDVCRESSLEGRGFGFNVLDCDNERSLDNIGFCARFSWIIISHAFSFTGCPMSFLLGSSASFLHLFGFE